MPPLAAYIVSPIGTCEFLPPAEFAVVHSKALRRAANDLRARSHWPSRRSPSSFPWGSVLDGETL
jgi:hypothetical protein